MDCGFSPFLATPDKAALDCALTVGTGTESVSFGGTLQGLPGATHAPCNGGFIRDDAALLIVIVSNKDDSTLSRPPAWSKIRRPIAPPIPWRSFR